MVSLPDASALGPHVKKAVDAGIPVVSMNSGSDVFQKFGILTHVGSDEAVAGMAGGRRLGAMGVKNAICVNDEVGNAALDTRCEGFTKGLAESGAKMKVLAAPTGDPVGVQNAVAASLQSDPTIDGVVTMGPDGAVPTLKAIKAADRLKTVKMATFDLGPDTLQAVQAGEVQFAIDQQQFLQGYMPVLLLMLYKQYLLMPGGGQPILSGPNFVTKDTAATLGWRSSASTASRAPCTRLRTPSGKPASRKSSARRCAPSGVRSEGFRTKVFPATTASGNIHSGIITGKLNGGIPAHTPTG